MNDTKALGGSLRALDSFEEFFFHLEPIAPALHIQAVHLKGETAERMWRQAWQDLHALHPLLRARILKTDGEQPGFVRGETDAEIVFEPWHGAMTLADACERALASPFTDPKAALVTLRVFHRPDECLVVLASHHSLYDGMSTLLLLQDLFDRLVGASGREGPPAWISLRQAVGAPARQAYRTTRRPGSGADALPREVPRLPPVQVDHLAFGTDLTARLGSVARRHGTTPHGALMVAFQMAGGHADPAWAEHGLGCNTPHSVRGALADGAHATGMLTMAILSRLAPSTGRPFWDLARKARDDLAPARTAAGKLAFIQALDELTADEVTSVEFLEKVARSPVRYALMITDYASYRPRSHFGPLKVTAIATGNNGGPPDTQTIGVCTIDGNMNVTQISGRPIEGLLRRCRDILSDACR